MGYDNYFQEHYRYTFSERDLFDYYKWFYAQFKLINKEIILNKNKAILEVGSAIGGFYQFLSGDDYLGLELDKDAVSFCNSFFKKEITKNISLEEFTTDKKFDYIFSFEVLEHMNNPAENIRKIYSLLKDGGEFVGTTPFPFLKNVRADKTHKYVLHPEAWRRLFQQAGFKDIRVKPLSFIPGLWRINKKLNIRLPFYLPFKGFISTCLFIASK